MVPYLTVTHLGLHLDKSVKSFCLFWNFFKTILSSRLDSKNFVWKTLFLHSHVLSQVILTVSQIYLCQILNFLVTATRVVWVRLGQNEMMGYS